MTVNINIIAILFHSYLKTKYKQTIDFNNILWKDSKGCTDHAQKSTTQDRKIIKQYIYKNNSCVQCA